MKYLKQTQERATEKSKAISDQTRRLIERLDEKGGDRYE
ncbi:hypothetical protein FHR85_002567 [Alkalibacillus almallahensis]|nr:hypothetical protein [Alkalibacillus almallahensis]